MNNTDKLLRAFIEASGYEIEEVSLAKTKVPKGADIDTAQVIRISGDGLYYTSGIDYKLTKKIPPYESVEPVKFVEGQGYERGVFVSDDNKYYRSLIGSLYGLNYEPLNDIHAWAEYVNEKN